MNQYYCPDKTPEWVNDDWLRANTQWDPSDVPLDVLAENGFYQLKYVSPINPDHSENLYYWVWSNTISSPYCLSEVSGYSPKPLPEAKAWMLKTYPEYAADIEAATSVDELQQILDSIPQA